MTNLLITLSLLFTTGLASDTLSDAQTQVASLDVDQITQFEEATPRATRAGWLRYPDERLLEPEAAPWLLMTLEGSDLDAEHRRAVADAFVRNVRNQPPGTWGAAWTTQIQQEQDATVRQVLIEGLRYASSDDALPALSDLLNHPNPTSRAAAASTIGWHKDGKQLAPVLQVALTDAAPSVRHLAARSLGYLGDEKAFESLLPLLQDEDPTTRAATLQALRRLDETRAASLPELASLQTDTSPQVRAAANALQPTSL